MSEGSLSGRKGEHLQLALEADVGFETVTTGFERYRLRSTALPEADLAGVDLSTSLFGRRLGAPLLISCMTGGTSGAGPVNRALAVAAQEHRVMLGLGSGRVLLEDDSASGREGFAVRDIAPDVVLCANLGAVQLRQYGVEECQRLLERCDADVLVLHLNAVQEAVQPGGDTDFSGVLRAIAQVCGALEQPVVVKEVGFGLGGQDVTRLADAGVAAVDVAGAGGTNWARVEGARDARAGRVASAFGDWGLPTAEAVVQARQALDGRGVVVIASGGLRHGVDALKALCLGADIVGFGRTLLPAAALGPGAATEALGLLVRQLRIALWACGASRPGEVGGHLLSVRDLRP